MGGGLMQLVAYGAQDIYLTGNPQITFFKIVYRRHTNFSMESIQQTFNESPSRDGGELNVIISRKGDLLYRMHLEVDLVNIYNSEQFRIETENKLTAATLGNSTKLYYIKWVDNTAHALIKECSIEIGGQLIDKHNSQWLDIHSEFFSKTNQLDILLNRKHIKFQDHMVGVETMEEAQRNLINQLVTTASLSYYFTTDLCQDLAMSNGGYGDAINETNNLTWSNTEPPINSESAYPLAEETLPPLKMYIPLQFWFCRHPGLALPLIALQYHDVKLSLTTRNLQYLVNAHPDVAGLLGNTVSLLDNHPSIKLYADYIYLDTDERRRFAQVSHEYLIEQVQIQKHPFTKEPNQIIPLDLNHPVKEIFWVIQSDVCLQESSNSNISAISNYPVESKVITGHSATGEEVFATGDVTDLVGVHGALGLVDNPNSDWWNSLTHIIDTPVKQGRSGVQQDLDRQFTNKNDYFNYRTRFNHDGKRLYNGKHVNNAFGTAKMVLNGSDRFSERDALYFGTVQHYQAGHGVPRQHIYCYSFALKPEEHQPSGTCNFSRIDNAELVIRSKNGAPDRTLSIFAINYNVLRIMSGMGGLAYSN